MNTTSVLLGGPFASGQGSDGTRRTVVSLDRLGGRRRHASTADDGPTGRPFRGRRSVDTTPEDGADASQTCGGADVGRRVRRRYRSSSENGDHRGRLGQTERHTNDQ
jgi:hypothetical protein